MGETLGGGVLLAWFVRVSMLSCRFDALFCLLCSLCQRSTSVAWAMKLKFALFSRPFMLAVFDVTPSKGVLIDVFADVPAR